MVIANGAPVEKLALNYLGASHENVQRKPAPDLVPTSAPIVIGYVGRFTRIKGVLDLARAIRSLPSSLAFTVEMHGRVGDSESAGIVKELREIARDDPRLRINPPIAGPDVPRVMASFDVLWVPSIWFENGPTVVSEAFAAGTPVIGTTIGAMPELIRHGIDGLLLEPGDWRSIASTIRRIVERPADTIDVWRTNVPLPRTMSRITEDYLVMYREVLAEKTAAVA
jgi:glycosyltransferase involved in cell wall biosynthesis